MAKHLYTFESPTNPKHLAEVVAVLEKGGLIIYPTDVNWAVGCDGTNPTAVTKIFNMKASHPKDKPLSLIMNSISQISEYATVSSRDYRILKKCLPGPFTFLLQRHRSLPKQIGDKRQAIGVRIPKSNLLHDLTNLFGRPIATSSLPTVEGREHGLRSGWEIEEVFGHCVDLIIDLGGELTDLQTSVIDLTSDVPILVRQGEGPIDWLDEMGLSRPDVN